MRHVHAVSSLSRRLLDHQIIIKKALVVHGFQISVARNPRNRRREEKER